MSLTFDDYINAVKATTINPRIKIEFLYPDETVKEEITEDIKSDGGNLSINFQNGVRKSCNVTLINIEKKYIPSPNTIWIKNKFKLWLGFKINGEDYFISQGIFVVRNPEVLSNYSEKTVNLTGIDKFALLDGTLGGELDGIYQIPVGTNIYEAIKSILVLVNDTKSPILDGKYISEVTPYTLRKEAGGNYGELLIELAGMLSANIYYNENGHLIFEEGTIDIVDNIKSPIWEFTTDEFEYLGSTVTYQFEDIFNEVLVIGDNIDGNIATGKATNTNLLSSTRTQLIGKRTKVIEDSIIYTDNLALQRANYELKRLVMLQSKSIIKSTPMYHLDVNKIITLTDDYYDFDKERFLIQSINIPFSLGSQIDIDVVNAVELTFDNV
jgi:hypothetical protein